MDIQKLLHTANNKNFQISEERYMISTFLNFVFSIILILYPFHGQCATSAEVSFQKEDSTKNTLAYVSVSSIPPSESVKISNEKQYVPTFFAGVEYLPMIVLLGEYLPLIVPISPVTT